MTRYILCRLAEKDMTKENFIDLWKYQENQSKDKYFWTIEHILPQSSKIESHMHKIGNLTMSGFNSSLSDKGFAEKRDRKNGDGKYIGYKNGLNLNKDLASKTTWTIADIETRSERLIIEAMELFKL